MLTTALLAAVSIIAVAKAEAGVHSDLTAVTGQGDGHVSVSPTARDRGEIFHAQVTLNVHGATVTTARPVGSEAARQDGHFDASPATNAGLELISALIMIMAR